MATRNQIFALAEQRIKLLYLDSYQRAMKIAEVRNALNIATDVNFTFKANPRAQKELNKILNELGISLNKMAVNDLKTMKSKGEETAEKNILSAVATSTKKIAKNLIEAATDTTRISQALGTQIANAKRGGVTLSERIWKNVDSSRKELEIIIQNNIIEGKGAEVASREVRQYLNDPKKLFRRVKDKETGEYHLSKAAQMYHPGQGKYRSSFMNARRLMVSEMNMATQASECAAYANNPLIAGYEIRLSNNHTVKDPRHKDQVLPLHDICDELQGTYPPTFKFTGWHPHCRCSMVPILISPEERRKLAQARAEGKTYQPKGVITDVPDNFKTWVAQNQDRIARAGSVPYFLTNNTETVAKIADDNAALYNIYKRDVDYKEVDYNPGNGALKAVHVRHKTHPNDDKTYFGEEKLTGDMLEQEFVREAYRDGHQIVMREEREHKVDLDMILDGNMMDLASVTGDNYKSALKRKNIQLEKYNAENGTSLDSMCLYFHDPDSFSLEKLRDTVSEFDGRGKPRFVKKIYVMLKGGGMRMYEF